MHSHNLIQWGEKIFQTQKSFPAKKLLNKTAIWFRGMCVIHIHVFVESSAQVSQFSTEMDSNFMVLS